MRHRVANDALSPPLDEDIREIYRSFMAKVLVSMPDELLSAIDVAVARKGTSRSAFLQAAARAALVPSRRDRVQEAVARGRNALADVGEFESARVIRASRDARDAADRRR